MNDPTITSTIDINDIRYETENINLFLTKVIPYNAKSYYPLHKFWIYVDKGIITQNSFYNKLRHITIALSLSSDCLKEIKEIEQQINAKLETDGVISESIINSKLEDSGIFVPTFQLIVDENSKLFETDSKELKNSKDINLKDCVELVCELDYVLIGNNLVKPIWRIVNLKRFELMDLKAPLFNRIKKSPHFQPPPITYSNIHNHNNTYHNNQPILPYHGPPDPNYMNKPHAQHTQQNTNLNINNLNTTSNTTPNTKPKISFMPSLQDLQSKLSALRKVKKEENIDSNLTNQTNDKTKTNQSDQLDQLDKSDLPNQSDQPNQSDRTNYVKPILPEKIELRHVKTKEYDTMQIFRNEHKMLTEYKNLSKLEKSRKKELRHKKKLEKYEKIDLQNN